MTILSLVIVALKLMFVFAFFFSGHVRQKSFELLQLVFNVWKQILS